MANRPVSGGGSNSRVVKSVGVRAGKPTTNVISPRGVSEYGRAVGDKLSREGSHTGVKDASPVFERKAAEPPLGNAVSLNVGKGGPGTGRTTYPSGYQALRGDGGPPLPSTGDWFPQQFPGVPTKEGK
jgi:hypothetical protein